MVVGYRENIEKKGLLVAGLDLNDVQARNGAGDRTQDYEILRMDVPGCPKTGQTSGNCPGMRYFSTTDLMRANHMFLGGLRTAQRGVPLFAHPDSAVSGNDVSATMMEG